MKAAIVKEQKNIWLPIKKRDEIWEQIAKTVDIAIAVEIPGKIQ